MELECNEPVISLLFDVDIETFKADSTLIKDRKMPTVDKCEFYKTCLRNNTLAGKALF